MTGIDFAKEGLLYIAMIFVTAGGTIITAKDYLTGAMFLISGAVLIIIRTILKKKGYELEEEKKNL